MTKRTNRKNRYQRCNQKRNWLYCTSFSQLRLLITSLISFRSFCSLGHYIVRPSPNDGFWIHLWYLFVLFVLLVQYNDQENKKNEKISKMQSEAVIGRRTYNIMTKRTNRKKRYQRSNQKCNWAEYIFDIFSFFLFSWSLYGTSFSQLQLLITSLISVRSFCSLGHYIVPPSPNYTSEGRKI
jgi:hypothetical protein